MRNAPGQTGDVDEKVNHITPVVLAAFAARALRELLLRFEKLLIVKAFNDRRLRRSAMLFECSSNG